MKPIILWLWCWIWYGGHDMGWTRTERCSRCGKWRLR